MDIVVEPRILQPELTLTLGIIESKATIPILSNILIRAEDNHVELAATDLEVTIRTRCPAEVIAPGGITVPARKFGAIVRAFAGMKDPLSMKTTEAGKLFIQPVGNKQEYHLQALPEEDYPTLLMPDDGTLLTLSADGFKRMVMEALVSVGTDDSRFSVRGGLLILEADKVVMVSTDSHRLTFSEWQVETGVETPLRVLVPRKTLTEFLKMDQSEELALTFKDNHVFMAMGPRLLYSRLMDATFPAYEKVLPDSLDKAAELDRGMLLEGLKRVSMVAESKTRAVTMDFDPGGNVEILVRNQETGDEGREFVPCENYEGEAISMVFNVDYLIDFLGACEEEKVRVGMKDGSYQALFEPVRPGEEAVHKHVIMPLRFD